MIAEIVLSTGTKLQYCFKIVFNFKRHPQHDYYIGLKIIFLMCTSKLKKLHIN